MLIGITIAVVFLVVFSSAFDGPTKSARFKATWNARR